MPDFATAHSISLHDGHRSRVRRMVLVCGTITVAVSLAWGVFFALMGAWMIVALEAVSVGLSGVAAALAWRWRTRMASRLILAAMYVGLSTLLMRDERSWLRQGVPALFFGSWVLLGASNFSMPSPLALSVAPEASLTMAPYINMVIAAIVLYAGLHVIQTDAADRNKLESELRNGLLRREFLLNYQPQVATGTRLVGAEVLIRWEHPKLGLIPPSEFIPLAERSGLMGQLGDWVLQGACQQLAHWARQHATAQCSLPMPTLLRMCWVLSSRQRLIQRA